MNKTITQVHDVVLIITGMLLVSQILFAQSSKAEKFYRGTPVNPAIQEMVDAVSADSIESYLFRLESFYTRHTLSDTTSSTTGIGAARRWIKSRYQQWSDENGGNLQPEFFWFTDLICGTTDLHANVNATLPGTLTPDRFFLVSGHMDNRNVGVCDNTIFAPGTNDDGSGTAASIEAARVMSQYDFDASLLFMCVTGEDQGLFGSAAFATYAAAQGIRIDGMLTNDIIGNIVDDDGNIDSTSVRHFSESPSTSPSRQLSRYYKLKGEQYVPSIAINLIPAVDRPGRSGDHVPFNSNGFAAVRFTEPVERFGNQHTDFDILDNMSPAYNAQITRISVAGLAAMALAPETPQAPLVIQDVGDGEQLVCSWESTNDEPDFAGYRVAWRFKDSLFYEEVLPADMLSGTMLTGLTPDAAIYVSYSAVDFDGNESIFSSEVLATPALIPAAVQNLDATSTAGDIELAWDLNNELDLVAYELTRTDPSGKQLDIALGVETDSYIDNSAAPGTLYRYLIAAVDSEGNRSNPSNEVRGQLATHDQGILIVDGSSDGNGGLLDPSDEQVDDFYADILEGFNISGQWDADDSLEAGQSIRDADMAIYSTVIWHTDVRQPLSPVSEDTTELKKYLENGGQLIISGWEPILSISDNGQFIKDFEPGQFIHDYFKIDVAQFAVQTDFNGADPLLGDFPSLTVDADHIPIWGGDLIAIESMQTLVDGDGTETIYIFRSSSDPPSQYHGLPVGVKHENGLWRTAVLTFPLFYFPADEAAAALGAILSGFGEVTGIDGDGDETDALPGEFALTQNYPNPFNPATDFGFQIAEFGIVSIRIYDVQGRLVQTIVDRSMAPGSYTASWDSSDYDGATAASGIYFYELRVQVGGALRFRQSRKMILIK